MSTSEILKITMTNSSINDNKVVSVEIPVEKAKNKNSEKAEKGKKKKKKKSSYKKLLKKMMKSGMSEKEKREYRCNYDLELCVFFANFHHSNSLNNITII